MKVFKYLIILLVFCCQLYGLSAALGGNFTAAPTDGQGLITEGVNLNDTNHVLISKDKKIYTLGATCVQRFNYDGSFDSGAYFSKTPARQRKNTTRISLHTDKIVIFSVDSKEIYVFKDDFTMIDTIHTDNQYTDADFYNDYPADNSLKDNLSLSLFNSSIKYNGEKITLNAPRNFWFSSDFGLILFACSSVVLGLYIAFRKQH